MIHPYAAGLLAVINAGETAAKDAILSRLAPPTAGAVWAVPDVPARPGRPAGVSEGEATRRRAGLGSAAGRRRFLHAIWHIELEAIDLACLLSLRGPGLPAAFHADCVRVAREEAVHAGLLAGWLVDHGYPPGSESVHHRLWDAARSCCDAGEQLVVVPRFLEARGLDVNAGLLPRLQSADPAAYAVLERIYRDEIRHVTIGTRWHHHWCHERGIDPEVHFATVVRGRFADQLPSPWPLDRQGRMAAGFTSSEMAVVGT